MHDGCLELTRGGRCCRRPCVDAQIHIGPAAHAGSSAAWVGQGPQGGRADILD